MSRKATALKLWNTVSRPSQVYPILHDLLGLQRSTRKDGAHLEEAIAWLCRAHDAAGRSGVSGGYYPPHGGWLEPYPETTGYIIPTLSRYSERRGDRSLAERCLEMGDWEIEIQMESGGMPGGVGVNPYPVVFNTGQCILGWTYLYRQTGEQRFLHAAARSAGWLAEIQDPDGKWSRHTHSDIPHAYHTRVAWPVLEVAELTDETRFYDCAYRNIDWVLGQCRPNGWIDGMSFREEDPPLTHTIAYTVRGLLECSRFLDDTYRNKALTAAKKVCEEMMLRYERRKRAPQEEPLPLPATFDADWKPVDHYSCVSGNAQFAIIWLKLYETDGDGRYLNAALKILDLVKRAQSLSSRNPGIRGAMPGSIPCWGKYNPFSFPNWATKFFADALMLEETVLSFLEGS